ncbi:MAG: hypothetical protein ACHQFW_07685 [Chitinophagales bacterium]
MASGFPLFGQISNAAAIDNQFLSELKNRKLILMIQDEEEFYDIKNTKPGVSFTDYKNTVDLINNNLKTVVDSLWPYHDEFLMLNYKELQKIAKADMEKYAVIYFIRYEEEGGGNYKKHLHYFNIGCLPDGNTYDMKNISTTENYSGMKLAFLENFRDPDNIFIPMSHLIPQQSDIAFGLSYVIWFLHMRSIDKTEKQMRDTLARNSTQITEITLLVSRADIENKNFIDLSFTEYPFEYKVVEQQELDSLILSRSEGFGYLNYNLQKACVVKTVNGEPLYVPTIYYTGSGPKSVIKMVADVMAEIEPALNDR